MAIAPDTSFDFASALSGAPSPAEVGRRVSEDFLARKLRFEEPVPGAGRYARFHYAEALAWYGASRVALHTNDAALAARLLTRFEPYLGARGAEIVPAGDHVDERVFGVLPLELFLRVRDSRLLELGLAAADAQWHLPTPDGITREARYWIDDMYMITVLQVQAYRATGEAVYVDRAARAMAAYLDRLQQPNGLFFHTAESPVFWGRGNGWVAAGMAELLSELDPKHALHARISDGYRSMMATLLELQSAEGAWRQILDDPTAWRESSASAMFTFAFVTGVKRGWLERSRYESAAVSGWRSTLTGLDAAGNLADVCVGAGHAHHAVGRDAEAQRQYYLALPRQAGDLHGQAPLLWAAAALLASESPNH
jgi:unsaturated rhamnogalacturonyl hydrolase